MCLDFFFPFLWQRGVVVCLFVSLLLSPLLVRLFFMSFTHSRRSKREICLYHWKKLLCISVVDFASHYETAEPRSVGKDEIPFYLKFTFLIVVLSSVTVNSVYSFPTSLVYGCLFCLFVFLTVVNVFVVASICFLPVRSTNCIVTV